MFAEFHEIEPVMKFRVNPFNTVGHSFFIKAVDDIYEAKVGRLELDFWSYRKT
jgi:adenosine/AMP kinase